MASFVEVDEDKIFAVSDMKEKIEILALVVAKLLGIE